jgi:hypothetical protein
MALPAEAQVSVRSALSHDREAEPGTRYEGTIAVRNDSDTPQQAKVYPTDYLFQADGSNEYGAPGSTARSNASWIRFSPSLLTIPPGESLPVQYVVTVPDSVAGAPPVGSYWSLLMVESIPAGSPESTLAPGEEPRFGVRQVMRYGVQIATHLRGTGARSIAFDGARVDASAEGAVLTLDLANTGSRMARPDVWVELFDAAGVPQGRLEGTKNRLYPGTSVQQRIPLGALAEGAYKALVVVDAGGEDIFGAEYVLEL